MLLCLVFPILSSFLLFIVKYHHDKKPTRLNSVSSIQIRLPIVYKMKPLLHNFNLLSSFFISIFLSTTWQYDKMTIGFDSTFLSFFFPSLFYISQFSLIRFSVFFLSLYRMNRCRRVLQAYNHPIAPDGALTLIPI